MSLPQVVEPNVVCVPQRTLLLRITTHRVYGGTLLPATCAPYHELDTVHDPRHLYSGAPVFLIWRRGTSQFGVGRFWWAVKRLRTVTVINSRYRRNIVHFVDTTERGRCGEV